MARTHRISRYQRCLAGALAALIGLGPLLTPAYAQLTALGDQPIAAQVKAKPNIMLTVDDSSSMLYDFLPDSVIGLPAGPNNYCRDVTGRMNAQCGLFDIAIDLTAQGRGRDVSPGYAYEQFGFPYPAYQSTIRLQGTAGVSIPKPIDNSGPGAGCNALGSADTTCSGGIDPGPPPGLERYPNPVGTPPAKSPKAGNVYEYWSLWPAPAHNSELNHLYYNPRITYDPPVDSAGVSYPQMNAGNTANWTHVVANPWAETLTYVDLTAQVTIGIWCNSDWSVGHEGDSTYCRTNGTGPGASSSTKATANGDYRYPWAPPGINPDDGVQPTTAKSIALSKVVFNATTHKYDLNASVWPAAGDPKYFYENDNVLWCDPTSPLFPAHGTITPGTCNAAPPTVQSCIGAVHQSCGGGVQSNCVGVTTQTCGGATPQTCPLVPQTCGGSVPQSCVAADAETCQGVGHQTCSPALPQTCNGSADLTCGGLAHEACVGAGPQTCNITAPSCIPPAPTCGSYDPPGCDATCRPGDPECSCNFIPCNSTCSTNPAQSCSVASECPAPGTCSTTHAFCDAGTPCAILSGACSPDSSISCSTSNDCPQAGTCLGAFCHAGDTCHQNGHCSATGASCTGTASGECPSTGFCSIVTTQACTDSSTCLDQPGNCSIHTGTPCFNDGTCFQPARCSGDGNACPPSTCPDLGGVCNIDFSACTPGSCRQAAHCTGPIGNLCHSDSECLPTGGACSGSGAACNNVTVFCPDLAGTCDSGATTPVGGCFNTDMCPIVGATCSVDTGKSCTAATQATDCPTHLGYCSGDSTHTPVCSDDSACLPIPHTGTCNGFSSITCTANADCPGFGSDPAAAVCSDLLNATTTSLLADAEGPGIVCRHNNRSGGVYTSGPYDYPNATFNTPVSGGTGPNACTASPRYATVARHYWKTGVEWCDSAVTTMGDEWLGYGSHAGTCQDSSDASHSIPRFYQFGAEPGCDSVTCPPTGIAPSAEYLDNYATPAFQRMDLTATLNPTFTHTFLDDSHTPQTVTRTFGGATPDVSEMTNYANWFAYYRTRITAVKTVTSLVFKDVDAQYRVGFQTMYLDPNTTNVAKFLNIADFTGTQPGSFYTNLFDVIIPLGQQTPTLDAMIRIGEHYKNGTVAGLPGSVDPITLSCQKNWHVLFTDGYTNQPALPTQALPDPDADLNVPAGGYPGIGTDPITGLVPGAAWPHPYREDPLHTASYSLSDYAMYYWVTDLKPGMVDNVPTCPSPRSYTCTDPANWQHVNFAAIALGTAGKLSASSPATTEALLTSGALQWPQPTPSVNKPDSSGVDDLWHAAVNSRGGFVNAETPDDVRLGLGQLLTAALNSTGTRAGVGFLSNTFGPSAKFLYRAQFTAGWGGSLAKILFDPTTGVPGAQQWDAADQLTAQLQVTVAHPTPWFTERKIVTMTSAGAKVPFLWANLSASQQNSLAPGKPARGQQVVEFLRGNRAKEGNKLGQLRKRPSLLGDIVDSSPVYVGAPNWPYTEDNDKGYSAFASGVAATRAARIYAGANDGMLHAFDDVTGSETWAYIPSPLYRADATGLGALSFQDGALPPFRHHFYVDSTPRAVDIDFNAPAGDGWHTILVGGMGKGGNRYYALDITHPVDAGITEIASTTNVLWEFPAPGDTTTDMGYTYGKPIIAKTRAFGGEWLVIVPVGYNNPSGEGKLYFLRARDGVKEWEIPTGFGSTGRPAGLAHAAGYTKDFRNQLLEQIYAGDLFGNLWRFNVSDSNPSNWTVGRMAQLVDAIGVAQPVTTPPEIKIDPANGVDRWVFVGTGRLLDDSDLTSPLQQQTLYAFRDGTDTTPVTPLPATPLSRTTVGMLALPNTTTASKFGLTDKPDKGWYDDLPIDPNQRIIVPPQAAAGIIGYVGTSPPLDDPCLTALPATIYARAYSTGQSALVDSDGVTILPSIFSDTGGVGVAIVAFETAGGTTGLDIRVAITGFDGSVKYFKTAPGTNGNKYRMSWRLLGQ